MTDIPILSTKLTSTNIKSGISAAFLDKIELNTVDNLINVERLSKLLTEKKIINYFDQARGSGRSPYLQVKYNGKLDLKFFYQWRSKQIRKIVLNLSSYDSFDSFIKDLVNASFPIEALLDLKIIRIDKTIDILMPFDEFTKCINIKFKRSSVSFTYESGKATGVQFGKGNEIIKIYDKSRKSKLNFNCSRIEIVQKGNKVYFHSLRELRSFWCDNDNVHDHSFDKIELNSLTFKETNKEKEIEFKYLLKHFPYITSRQVLNSNGNFIRDYRKYVDFIPWKYQPSEIFNFASRKFFNSSENEVVL